MIIAYDCQLHLAVIMRYFPEITQKKQIALYGVMELAIIVDNYHIKICGDRGACV